MCLGKLYQIENSDKSIMDSIARLRLLDGQLEVETLFGEKKVFSGILREIDFVQSKIIVET